MNRLRSGIGSDPFWRMTAGRGAHHRMSLTAIVVRSSRLLIPIVGRELVGVWLVHLDKLFQVIETGALARVIRVSNIQHPPQPADVIIFIGDETFRFLPLQLFQFGNQLLRVRLCQFNGVPAQIVPV